MRTASIEDVAQAAAVSTATVSRVVNSPNLVAPATAARVQRAMAELGYRPNPFAKGLTTHKSNVLGIALPDIHGEFYSEMLRGADAEARRLGYHLLVSSEARISPEPDVRTSFASGLIDGLAVMITEPDDRLVAEVRKSSVPLVVVDSEAFDGDLDTVIVDSGAGAVEATRHLLESVAADRCHFVGGPKDNFDTIQRARAFEAELTSRSAVPRPDQIAFGAYTMEWGQEWAAQRLKGPGLRGTGILAGNDEIAYGVMSAVMDAGLGVPGDVRIVGFDDTRLASIVRPRLSTVALPIAELGATAVRLLVDRLAKPQSPTVHVKLPSRLVVRESSAPSGHKR